MKFRALIYENTRFYQPNQINDILSSNGFSWLINAEFENALVEIKDETIIWHGGTWFHGTWEYGVFMDGVWKSGIWKGGVFKNGIWESGTWETGIFLNGFMKKSIWKDGEFRGGIKGKDVKTNESFTDKEQKTYRYENKEKFSSSNRTTYTVSRFSDLNYPGTGTNPGNSKSI